MNKKLNILSLQFYSYPDEVGGAWKLTYEVNKRLAERGHRVFLITCKPEEGLPDYEIIGGTHYYRIGFSESKSVTGLWRGLREKINAISSEFSIDLIHIHNPLIEFILLTLPQSWKIPKVYHFHSLWFDEEKINKQSALNSGLSLGSRCKLGLTLNVIRLIEWTCFCAARSVLFLSQYSKNRFCEFFPWKKSRLKIIPGGVDIKEFRPGVSGLTPAQCRQKLNLPLDQPVLLTVRRLAARMGLENLISACAIIVKCHPQLKFHLAIVGKGELFDRLSALIENHNLKDRVRLTGMVSAEDLPLYYGAADIFVIPTVSIEGFGLATAEALSSGLPVLGTPVGGTVEILNAIDSRLLFENSGVEAIASGIEKFLFNPQPYLDLKNDCRQQAVDKYGWEQVVDRIEEEFLTVSKNGYSDSR